MGASTVIVATGYNERGKNGKNFMQAFQPGRRVSLPFPKPNSLLLLPVPEHKLVPMPTPGALQAHYSPAEWQHYERQYPMGPRL